MVLNLMGGVVLPNPAPNYSVERDGLQAALANTLSRFAAPAAPHVKR